MMDIAGISDFSLVNGFSIISGSGSNYGISFIKLDNWSDRKADSLSVESITAKLFKVAATIPDAQILFFQPPSVPGFGASSGFEAQVLDRQGGSFNELSTVTNDYLQELMNDLKFYLLSLLSILIIRNMKLMLILQRQKRLVLQ